MCFYKLSQHYQHTTHHSHEIMGRSGMSEDNKRIKKEGVWYYSLVGERSWKSSRGMKGVVTYARSLPQPAGKKSSTHCRIGTALAQVFLEVASDSTARRAGDIKYFKKYNLMVTHTIAPSGSPPTTKQLVLSDAESSRRRSMQPLLPIPGSVGYVPALPARIESLSIHIPQEEEEVYGEFIVFPML